MTKKIKTANIVIRQKSGCGNCMANKSLLLIRNLKVNALIFVLNFQYTKHADILFKVQERQRKCRFKVLKTRNGRIMLSSKCALRSNKKSRFIHEQEAKGLLSSLSFMTPLSNIPLIGKIFF